MATVEPWIERTASVEETQAVACWLAKERLQPGMRVALTGPLGAGKTAFVQGLAEGLGVHELEEVVSPTYTLVNEYPGNKAMLVHLDLYRLGDVESAQALGLHEEIVRQDAVVAVEWGDQFRELIPDDSIWVNLRVVDAAVRQIEITGLSIDSPRS